MVRCFSYGIAQNKGNPQEIQNALGCIVPHAFGKQTHCKNTCCRYQDDRIQNKHGILPYGKDLFGEELKSVLITIFNNYSTETVEKSFLIPKEIKL